MKQERLWLIFVAILIVPVVALPIEPTSEVARVQSCAGGPMSDGIRTTVTAVAQSSPLGYSENGTYLNQGGFLHGSTLTPKANHDADGDGIQDWTELIGTALASGTPPTPSSPIFKDTDGDGLDDRQEYLTGTNPNDPLMFLRVLKIRTTSNGLPVVTFAGRGGFLYDIIQSTTVSGLRTNPNVSATITASGGVGPWIQTVSVVTNSPVAGLSIWGVRKN